eukprot:scaffold60039_cov19-Tisochrysis_lutea.AAC.3
MCVYTHAHAHARALKEKSTRSSRDTLARWAAYMRTVSGKYGVPAHRAAHNRVDVMHVCMHLLTCISKSITSASEAACPAHKGCIGI